MSEENNKLEHMFDLTGDKFTIPLFETEIKRNESKKGVVYPAPTKKFVVENLPTVMQWLGEKRAASIIYSRIKQLMQGLYDEYFDEETGQLDIEKFTQAALNQLDTRGETKADLMDEREDLFKSITPDVTKEEMAGIVARIHELNEAIVAKERAPRKPKALKADEAQAPVKAAA